MSPTPRAGILLGALALATLIVPIPLALLGILALATAIVIDAFSVRNQATLERSLPNILSRGVAARLTVEPCDRLGQRTWQGSIRLRQPSVPDITIDPQEGDERLDATICAHRRGRHHLEGVSTRREGSLRLGRWYRSGAEAVELHVYPDLHAARRLASAVRQGRFRDPGKLTRGPFGLGTDFESIRDYLPDDDIRQVNWRATARLGRPMSNQYRVEQDREIICAVDIGRLMTAPLENRTRLDAAMDAMAAVAAVADEVGDRFGALAFDSEVRRVMRPGRNGGSRALRAFFDLEPTMMDSDYELAFRSLAGRKRAFVLVLTDLLDEGAARSLLESIPVLTRHHAVTIASSKDADLGRLASTTPTQTFDAYAMSVAAEMLDARERVAAQLRRAGADVLEAPANSLGPACVAAYLRAKRRALL